MRVKLAERSGRFRKATRRTRELLEDSGYKAWLPFGYKQKWPPWKGRPLSCWERYIKTCLTLEVAPGHAERTEGSAQQHYSSATVRDSPSWAKEYPAGKTIPKRAILRNREDPS